MSDLTERLKQLAGRGKERGAAAVFDAATRDAAAPAKATITPLQRKATVFTAIAASVALVGGIAAALTVGDTPKKTEPRDLAAAVTTSTSSAAPAATTPTTISEATKVYLASTRLIPFDQCGAVTSYAKKEALKVVGAYGLPGGGYGQGGVMTADSFATGGSTAAGSGASDGAAAPPVAARSEAQAGVDYSDTNVQEAGIDEPDSVKTDGKTIFHARNGKLFATSAGSAPALLGSLDIAGATEMLRIANRLIVVSPGHGVYASDTMAGGGARAASSMPYGGGTLKTRFTVVDISNPKSMKETGHLDVEGDYVSARTVDGVARIVLRSNPNLTFAYPTDGTPEAQAAAKAQNVETIRNTTINSWLPHFTATDNRNRVQASKPLVSCNASYRPPAFSGFGMLSVLSFNTENPSFSNAASVMAGGEIVYASPTRVYVATNSWGDVSADGQSFTPGESTLIHAFDISDPVQAKYRESGRVRGTVLNQFAMSEYKGALRVATTDSAGGSESFMTVLGDSGSALMPVGQVGGLGKGERIYSVRFIEQTAYVVTFRQVDPLYVIDLSQPTNPKVLGELKITGYSAYLHPMGDGLLLGVGQEATLEGRRAGLSASVFDVRNPAEPKLVSRYTIAAPNGSSSSNAEFDHHAFLYWPATKLTVLPVNIYDYTTGLQPFNGAVGLKIGDTTIDEIGRVQPPQSQQDPNVCCYRNAGVERSVVIGDRIYMTTPTGVMQTRLDNLSQTAFVTYPS